MLEEIRKIYAAERKKPNGRPLDRLWEWAMGDGTKIGAKERSRRFEALSEFARKHRDEADDQDSRELWDANAEQYRKKYRFFKEKADKPPPTSEVGTFDGKPVAGWWVAVLKKARDTGLWHGGLTSGYRSPEYSTQLCQQMCGAPTCPGRCAGATSNHARLDGGAAIDVSDPAGFRAALVKIGRSDLHNALGAADPWHFSESGR